jgi:intracellular sulfur oxidation DsrE/DsrF family protein
MDLSHVSNRHDLLHALADGQLDAPQSREVLTWLEHDPALQKELCEIQRLKHLVRTAYPLTETKPAHHRPYSSYWRQVAVYLLAFGLTFLAGFGSSRYLPRWHQAEGITLDNAAEYDNRFIVFLDSHEPARLEKAINKAENLAQQVGRKDGSVYVVTSAEGIDLLRLGATHYENRIIQMSQKYPHLRFVACSNTLYSFKQRGELVELVEPTEVAPSAVEFVVKHMQEGWRYIAI